MDFLDPATKCFAMYHSIPKKKKQNNGNDNSNSNSRNDNNTGKETKQSSINSKVTKWLQTCCMRKQQPDQFSIKTSTSVITTTINTKYLKQF